MGSEATQFKRGNPGKPKGTKNKVTTEQKELFNAIMEGEIQYIKAALDKLRTSKPERYLDSLSKFFPYFKPKKLEVDTPQEMVIHVKRRG
jgi:hypothetical protein